MTDTGAFSEKFARSRHWKMDPWLQQAISMAVQHCEPKYVLDIGAGAGEYVRWIREQFNIGTMGFDGTQNIEEISGGDVRQSDFTEPGVGSLARVVFGSHSAKCMVMCIEVGEHIPPLFLQVFLDNIAAAGDELLVSWATEGQRGRDHVSCRSPEWVAWEFNQRGFSVDHKLTADMRTVGHGWDRKLLYLRRAV